jgi:predicted AlkP superfamily phosphohydrolase/phosphomutase
VPGVLFSSHKFIEDLPAIVDIAPTILKLFGLALPSHFGGKAWDLAAKAQ